MRRLVAEEGTHSLKTWLPKKMKPGPLPGSGPSRVGQ